ncbi:MAG: hypothetical protein EB127_12365 [Alphaproteobacteria bacterium]|nr:hypothetical protein [Alphaproteobacteria bacterium]
MVNSLDVINERVVRNGHVAVLVSHGYGAGWYTWHHKEELLYDPVIVDMVERKVDNLEDAVEAYIHSKYPDDDQPYVGGVDGLAIYWVPVGERFRIDEYDGAESLVLESQEVWLTA